MKTWKLLLVVLILLMSPAFYIVQSTGYFRIIENRFEGSIAQTIAIAGAEDMQIDYASGFLLLSSDDRASRRDGDPNQGALCIIDLNQPDLVPRKLPNTLSGPFYPHGISMKRINDSLHRVLVVNHVRDIHSIEVFDFRSDSLIHLRTLKDASIISPNDVVALDGDRFYFTNDHGYDSGIRRVLEEYLGLKASNVTFYDGTEYRQVADGIAYANGINFDPARNLLFVASPRGFLVKVYEVAPYGELSFVEDIDCGTGVDNIEFDHQGKLWIGAHPSLLHYAAYAKAKEAIAPSEIIRVDYRDKGDYEVKSIYLEDGSQMSGATVAVPYEDLIFVGNVMDDHFLVLRQE